MFCGSQFWSYFSSIFPKADIILCWWEQECWSYHPKRCLVPWGKKNVYSVVSQQLTTASFLFPLSFPQKLLKLYQKPSFLVCLSTFRNISSYRKSLRLTKLISSNHLADSSYLLVDRRGVYSIWERCAVADPGHVTMNTQICCGSLFISNLLAITQHWQHYQENNCW